MPTLSPQQEEAIRTLVPLIKSETPKPLVRLDGFAGTGKSTILPEIIEATGIPPEQVAFMAPTGKAAKVMRNKLKAQGYPNPNAGTIHSAIYRAKPAPVATLEADLFDHQERAQRMLMDVSPFEHDAVKKSHEYIQLLKAVERLKAELSNAYREDKLSFQLNVDSPVGLARLIVIDEFSMVGGRMLSDLQHFGVPIFAMGDPGQLPPVQDEDIMSSCSPDFLLTEVHRQAEGNPILHLATLARQGREIPLGDYGQGVKVMQRYGSQGYTHDFDDPEQPQIICGMNKTRWKVTRQFRDGRSRGPETGEPLIVAKNSRNHPALVNGSPVTGLRDSDMVQGRATFEYAVEDEEGVKHEIVAFQGLFEEHYHGKGGFTAPDGVVYRARKNSVELDFGYAITVHKSQGSQYDKVVLIDESSIFREDADRHLYTGITRAAKELTILV